MFHVELLNNKIRTDLWIDLYFIDRASKIENSKRISLEMFAACWTRDYITGIQRENFIFKKNRKRTFAWIFEERGR